MNTPYRALLVVCLVAPAFPQATRIDPNPAATTQTVAGPGQLAPLLALPGSAITLCGYPANAQPCTNLATTYTDASGATPCPLTAQVVLPGTNQCVATADAQGNFGFWVASGTYNYEIIWNGQTYGPYPITASGSATPSLTTDQVTYVAPNGGTAQPLTGVLAQHISVKDFGAVGDGATDDTAAFNKALTAGTGSVVFAPAANYQLNGAISVPANTVLQLDPGTYALGVAGQVLLAQASSLECVGGADATILSVPATYAAPFGVIVLSTGATSNQTVEGCQIQFAQPASATTRAQMTPYAAYGIYASQTAGVSLLHNKITGAWNGINLANGASNGKMLIDDLKMSSFNHGIEIDASFDTVRVNNLHWWPWNLANSQYPAFFDPANIGIYSGRCDDLMISNSLFIGGLGVQLYTSASGSTFGSMSNIAFDTYPGLVMASGSMTISSSYFSLGTLGAKAIVQTGGQLVMSAIQFGIVTGNANAINISGASQFYISASYFNTGANDISTFDIEGANVTATVTGCQFLRSANRVFVNPTVLVNGSSRIILADNYLTDKGTGTSYFLTITADGWDIIHDNALLGWSVALPLGYASLSFHNNTAQGP